MQGSYSQLEQLNDSWFYDKDQWKWTSGLEPIENLAPNNNTSDSKLLQFRIKPASGTGSKKMVVNSDHTTLNSTKLVAKLQKYRQWLGPSEGKLSYSALTSWTWDFDPGDLRQYAGMPARVQGFVTVTRDGSEPYGLDAPATLTVNMDRFLDAVTILVSKVVYRNSGATAMAYVHLIGFVRPQVGTFTFRLGSQDTWRSGINQVLSYSQQAQAALTSVQELIRMVVPRLGGASESRSDLDLDTTSDGGESDSDDSSNFSFV